MVVLYGWIAWQVLSLLIFTVGTKLLNERVTSLCPCGKEFMPHFPLIKKLLGPLRDDGNRMTWARSIKISITLIGAWQLIPIFFGLDWYWRTLKYFHGRNCLPFQVQRTERS